MAPLWPELTVHARKWHLQTEMTHLRPEMTHSRPEMTMQVVDVTGRSLLYAANQLKTTAFCFSCILYSAKLLETTSPL